MRCAVVVQRARVTCFDRYTDFAQLRNDPDLQELRGDPKFEGLLSRFEKKRSGLGALFEGFL